MITAQSWSNPGTINYKIQIKRENITFNLFPKIKEYDKILSNYFKNDKKIDLFKRINYLDDKYSNINIYDYYDNSIYKKENNYSC